MISQRYKALKMAVADGDCGAISQRSTLRGTWRDFLPSRGPPTPQKLECKMSAFLSALNLAVIGSLVIHVNVHKDRTVIN